MKMIIGHTGLIGKELCKREKFEFCVNSSTIQQIKGKEFSLVICAAPSASMFLANRNPGKDKAEIEKLIDVLKTISVEKFILISSVAVLKNYEAENELSYEREIEKAYGRNRGNLEIFCQEKFQNPLILRLPSLFSSEITKNFIFDILNPVPSMLTKEIFSQLQQQMGQMLEEFYIFSDVEQLFVLDRNKLNCSGKKKFFENKIVQTEFSSLRFTSPDSIFQFYPLNRLCKDIPKFLKLDSPIVHVSPPPFTAHAIFNIATEKQMPKFTDRQHKENMRTSFNKLFHDGSSEYMFSEKDIQKSLIDFFRSTNARELWGLL